MRLTGLFEPPAEAAHGALSGSAATSSRRELIRLSDYASGWKDALESVSVEQESISAQVTDNLCVHRAACIT